MNIVGTRLQNGTESQMYAREGLYCARGWRFILLCVYIYTMSPQDYNILYH